MTLDQIIETNLIFTLILNCSIVLVLAVSLVPLALMLPQIFRTFKQGSTIKQTILWPVDVLRQPLLNFSLKGNLVLAYVYFSRCFLGLTAKITLYGIIL